MQEPVDLARHLRAFGRSGLPGEIGHGSLRAHGHAPFVDHALVFFLQLDEDRAVVIGDAVAAQPQLFLVHRRFDRAADQLVVVGVIVDAAHRAAVVRVGHDMVPQFPEKRFILPAGEKILFFIALEDKLRIAHGSSRSLEKFR